LRLSLVFQGLDQSQVEARRRTSSWSKPPKLNVIPAWHYWHPEYREKVLPKSVMVDNRPGASTLSQREQVRDSKLKTRLFAFDLVSVLLGMFERFVLPGVKGLFHCELSGKQSRYLFIEVVVYEGEPGSPSEIDTDRF
jgi:hypothetical protein